MTPTSLSPAPFAGLSAIAQLTGNTAIATGVSSPAVLRIDSFLKQCTAAASSDVYSSAKHSAQAVARHGFVNSANSRFAAFLAAFQEQPDLTAKYAEDYPACSFLNWKAFHALRRVLNLWCDTPENYAGGVPDDQVPWMDIFELGVQDHCGKRDIVELLEWNADQSSRFLSWPIVDHLLQGVPREVQAGHRFEDEFEIRPTEWEVRGAKELVNTRGAVLRQYGKQLTQGFFVLAPKEAFLTSAGGEGDWIERFRHFVEDQKTAPTKTPEDPLVIRFCRGGALVVAAWGDEAKVLNEAVNNLGL